MTDRVDDEPAKHDAASPYTPRHPVPTVQDYRGIRAERQRDEDSESLNAPSTDATPSPRSGKSKRRSLLVSAKGLLRQGSVRSISSKGNDPKDREPPKAENRNEVPVEQPRGQEHEAQQGGGQNDKSEADATAKDKPTNEANTGKDTSPDAEAVGHGEEEQDDDDDDGPVDTSERVNGSGDLKKRRKFMTSAGRGSRQVTDPVTHLPMVIHDVTQKELDLAPENEPSVGSHPRSATGVNATRKTSKMLEQDREAQQASHDGLMKTFPPPNYDLAREELASTYASSLLWALGPIIVLPLIFWLGADSLLSDTFKHRSWKEIALIPSIVLGLSLTVAGAWIVFIRGWLQRRVRSIWEDQVWHAARKEEKQTSKSPTPESVQWLNLLMASIWPLVNADLFVSLADTLEDVMQASVPRLVRMVGVEDLGQGSESLRILGIRWLPTGAAASSVSKDGQIKRGREKESDRRVPGEGEVEGDNHGHGDDEQDGDEEKSKDEKKDTKDDENIAEGMEAEDGDFVNVEVAFSYRASSHSKSLKKKTKNAHLLVAFYLPGHVKLPVWVEMRGVVGSMRMRLQLCPDPPFISLATCTLLGQPKVDLACTPLTRKGLNIMDLPLISSFVRDSVDAALAEYVAPKSLTLDLKEMLIGDDFKKDTTARGAIMVRVKRGRDFKAGDPGFLGVKDGTSDAYVTVGWAKFGKPIWSTRVIVSDMQPVWEETGFILVGPEELNAQERLRIQLWDSDRVSADDDLGRIEVDLSDVMKNSNSNGKMWDRTDGFQSLESKEKMPGTLDWSVGYFAKANVQPEQLEKQHVMPGVKTMNELVEKVSEEVESKLREAVIKDEAGEIDQQKAQHLKAREDAIIIDTPPLEKYATGILSIQIHQITGLELEQVNRASNETADDDGYEGGANDLPSAYCTVIINHQKVFKTRTKPKNAKPTFNAATERLIRDWGTTEVMVLVRDSRFHENDPLLGIILLPLRDVLSERSQVMHDYPLMGGIGYGRAKISLVFRSIELQAPKELLGWDYGTLEIGGPVTAKDLAPELENLRLKLHTPLGRGKMYSAKDEGGRQWKVKHDRKLYLAVRKRYCSCMTVEFRKNTPGLDKTAAFATLWLKDIPDEEEVSVDLQVWRADKAKLGRAQANAVQTFEGGEKLGTITVPITLRRGLGNGHQKYVRKNPNVSDVWQALQTADENKEKRTGHGDDEDRDDSDSDASNSDSDGEESATKSKTDKMLGKIGLSTAGKDRVDDGKGGPLKQIKDYQAHSEELNRRNKGLMQWKGARKADYLKTKAEHGKDHVAEVFKHSSREPGVETEV